MATEKVEEKLEVEEKVEVLDFKALKIARQKLSDELRKIWTSEELAPVRVNLKAVGEKVSTPYSEAAEESGYAKLLEDVAEKLKLRDLMRSAWGKE